jgi:hypothetical protein
MKEITETPSGKEESQVNRQEPDGIPDAEQSQSAEWIGNQPPRNPWTPLNTKRPQWYVGCDILCTNGDAHLNWARVTSDGTVEYFCNNRDDRIIYANEVYMWRLTEFAKMYGKSKPTEDPTFRGE